MSHPTYQLLYRSLLFVLLLAGLANAQNANPVQKQGPIIASETWTKAAGPYLITGDLTVRSQATLTIEAGTEVRFAAQDALNSGESPTGVEFIVEGKIIVNGTAIAPVVFNGQNTVGASENATGMRFAVGALESRINYLNIYGLATGIDVRTFSALTYEHLDIDVSKIAYRRTVGNIDTRFVSSRISGGMKAVEIVGLTDTRTLILEDSDLFGDLEINGSQSFNSSIDLQRTNIHGNITINGSLLAGSSVKLTDSNITDGMLHIAGDINTGASIHLSNANVQNLNDLKAIWVEGSILADTTIAIANSELHGHIELGTTLVPTGAAEGQYFLIDQAQSWTSASQLCQSYGARLADIRSAQEAEVIFHLAKKSTSKIVWTAGTQGTPPCIAGDQYVDVGEDACLWQSRQYPTQITTKSRPCNNCNYAQEYPTCSTVRNTSAGCFPIYSSTYCQQVVSKESKIPNCDANSNCYGNATTWTWSSGGSFDSALTAYWARGTADQLKCWSGTHRLLDELHIAVDAMDNTGSDSGRFGLWRARKASEQYAVVCEGKLTAPSRQDANRGSLSVTDSTITGDFSVRLGSVTLDRLNVSGLQNYILTRDASIQNSDFTGSLNIATLGRITISNNTFATTTDSNQLAAFGSLGSGISLEADFSTITQNKIDKGAYGLNVRGPAKIENNVITRSELVGILHYPEAGPSADEDSRIVNNTLVDNQVGLQSEGTINAKSTLVGNNSFLRGNTGIKRVGANIISLVSNNLFGYAVNYQNIIADAGSTLANPLTVADFPTAESTLFLRDCTNPQTNSPIPNCQPFRLNSGSPLIDKGSCAIAPVNDHDGTPRPFDGDFDGALGCDIGAYEFGPEFIEIVTDRTPATGTEVVLAVMGTRDGFRFEVKPVQWTIDRSAGIFNEADNRFRPTHIPGNYPNALSAKFGSLSATKSLNLDCGCLQPDLENGNPGGCNGVPACYYTDWTGNCAVRQNYCQSTGDAGIVNNIDPTLTNSLLTLGVEETVKVRAGARDPFGFVFRQNGTYSYSVISGGGSIDGLGRFTAGRTAQLFANTLRVSIADGAKNYVGLSNVRVEPGVPNSIRISRASNVVGTTLTLAHTAEVLDRFGNIIPNAQVTWSLVNGGDSRIDPNTGILIAGCASGVYRDAIVATYESISTSLDLEVLDGGATLKSIDIIPPYLEISATTTQTFEATVTDQCNYTRPARNPIYTSRITAGSINAQSGLYQASCALGTYDGGVSVAAEGLQTNARILITSAPLASISVQPATAQIRVGEATVFEALGQDTCGRLKSVEPLWSTPITGAVTQTVGVNSQQRVSLGCSPMGVYNEGVIARVGAFEARAKIEVLAGTVSTLNVNELSFSIPAGNQKQIIALAKDSCDNDRSDAIRYSTSIGQITATGSYKAGCTRGLYNNAILITAGNLQQNVTVDISDGVLNRVQIQPSPVVLSANSSRQLRADLFDGCNNVIVGQANWFLAAGGSITSSGVITAGTLASNYIDAVVAELNGFQAKADLTVTPGPAVSLTINPNPLKIPAGSTQALSVIGTDQFGNQFDADVLWTINASAGAIDNSDVFTASSDIGVYENAITAKLGNTSVSINVEVIPAAVASINLQPSPVLINAGTSVQLTATPTDRFGNRVNSPITWSVEGESGNITEDGLFTANTVAGLYENTIVARSGGITAKANVRILPSAPSSLRVVPEQIIVTPQQSLQISANVFDEFNNLISQNIIYSIENGGGLISPTGLLTASTVANTYANTLLVRGGGLERRLNIQVIPGNPVAIQVEPSRLVVQPLQQQQLNAIFVDAFDNHVTVESVWAIAGNGGTITPTGLFTAGAIAGTYTDAVVVRGSGLEKFVTAIVEPGPTTRMKIDPELINTIVDTTVQLQVIFEDAQGNRTVASGNSVTWSVAPGSPAQINQSGLLTVACQMRPGLYQNQVIATVQSSNPNNPFIARASVDVAPGEVEFVRITPNVLSIPVTSQANLTATSLDGCGNNTLQVPRWSIVDGGSGQISPAGNFTASTKAQTVTVQATTGNVIGTATIHVTPGEPRELVISPESPNIVVDDREVFTVSATDEYDNRWVPENIKWTVNTVDGEPSAGTIIEQTGEFTAAQKVGRFRRAIQAQFINDAGVAIRNAYADVFLIADEADHLELSPSNPNVIATQSLSFNTRVFDQFENEIINQNIVYTCRPEVGVCSSNGVLTATEVVGTYPNAIEARLGDIVARTDINVINGDPARIEITPSSLRTHVGAVEELSAKVYDTANVLIANAVVDWRVIDPDIGIITPTPQGGARLVVGNQPKNYFGGITANIMGVEANLDVLIPKDNDNDGIQDILELENNLDPTNPDDASDDSDNDGLTNAQEVNANLDLLDADSDDDGVIDGEEKNWNADTDGDSAINALDDDSDNDGLKDGTEQGKDQPNADTDRSKGSFVIDADPSTTTDPLSDDSDKDGAKDGEEDSNFNGKLDKGETPADSDYPYISCDPAAEVTGCTGDLVCEGNICVPPVEQREIKPKTNTSCQSQSSSSMMLIALLSMFVIFLRRRNLV